MNLTEAFANPDDLLALEPEELAGHLLAHLNTKRGPDTRAKLSRLDLHHDSRFSHAWADKRQLCVYALMEAWSVLEREVLIAPDPEQNSLYFVTRRGSQVRSVSDYSSFRHAQIFPKGVIHPIIEQGVYPLFLRGDYETAIFKAFKEVEVAVKSGAPNVPQRLYGVDLMRAAFHPDTGPLRDTQEPAAEREALQHLFAGALGRFKNPPSHRHVPVTSPEETVEILQFASHLLRLVNDRTAPPRSGL